MGTRVGAIVGEVVGYGVGSPAAVVEVTVVVMAFEVVIPALTMTLFTVEVRTEYTLELSLETAVVVTPLSVMSTFEIEVPVVADEVVTATLDTEYITDDEADAALTDISVLKNVPDVTLLASVVSIDEYTEVSLVVMVTANVVLEDPYVGAKVGVPLGKSVGAADGRGVGAAIVLMLLVVTTTTDELETVPALMRYCSTAFVTTLVNDES